jgi:adenine/guanine phosphoribosyltransferase-like PRPP-binding protein
MKKSLLNERLIGKEKKIKFNYDKFIKAVEAISEDIKANFDLEKGDIGIIGVARGGLPLIVSVSHEIGVRKISTLQLQMSNSDGSFDFGDVKILGKCIDERCNKFILFDDIICRGKSTNAAISILKEMGKEVLAAYVLVVDEGFKEFGNENDDVPLKYVYDIEKDDWVYFFWETNINKID